MDILCVVLRLKPILKNRALQLYDKVDGIHSVKSQKNQFNLPQIDRKLRKIAQNCLESMIVGPEEARRSFKSLEIIGRQSKP